MHQSLRALNFIHKIISGGFFQKLRTRMKGFNAIELIFDEAVNGFDIRSPSVSAAILLDGFEGL